MIKLTIYFFLNFFLFVSIKADIAAIDILKNRLKKIDNFYVCFIQKINTPEGKVKEISQGELWIKKPNLFYCHILDPEESFLISDGKTLWFYVPIIKQVTAYDLKKSLVNNIFLKLLFNYNISKWNDYDIIQKKDWFYLRPIGLRNVHFEKYKIKINDHGTLDLFSIVQSNAQEINYYLFNQRIVPINISKFRFLIPKNVQFDDQRQ